MRVNVLCVTPPEKFFKWADKKKLRFDDFTIVTPNAKEIEGDRIVFLTYDLFVRFSRRVDIDADVYVFCPFHQILQYSKHVNFLDIKARGFDYTPKKLSIPKALVDFEFERGTPYVKMLEDHVESGSILTHLMTFIYTLDSKNQQKPVTYAICCWMLTDKPWEVLIKTLTALEHPIKPKHLDVLNEIFSLPIASKIRKALQDVTDMASVPQVALVHGVDPYELRYILGKSNYVDRKIDDDIVTR